jgi:putative transposase
VRILKGVVSADHIHLHLSYPSKLAVSELMRRIKGRSARKLLQEYPTLKTRYPGGHLWGIGYGAWSTGAITDEMVNEYLEHHRHGEGPNGTENFILE